MAPKRSYDDGCATAHALDLVGERWALLVVRELLLGPKRFTDLRDGLPGVSPNILARRLRELGDAGVVRHRKLPPPIASHIYELTDWGYELDSIVIGLGRWALLSPALPTQAPLSRDSYVLSLRVLFDADAARGLTVRFTLRLDEVPFGVEIVDGTLRVTRGEIERPAAIIETNIPTLHALLRQRRNLQEAVDAGSVRFQGDWQTATRIPELFPLPRWVPVP
jgi:DNA-binding HxlR family transcriptional regulator